MNYSISKNQACRFILLKHGLLGEHRFIGKQGALDFVVHAGCIQFDPVDICGKNAELTLQSRVKGFTKEMLNHLLYKDRLLVDYQDKQLSIFPTEHWPFFARYREAAKNRAASFEGLADLERQTLHYIKKNGPVSSLELHLEGDNDWLSKLHWNWDGKTKAAQAALTHLYSIGKLVIHHKIGTRKYYDLAENHIPAEILTAPDPLPDTYDHLKWRVLRRIGAVGLLWDRPSHAWLNIHDLKTDVRKKIFKDLSEAGEIIPVTVEGINAKLYCKSSDTSLLESVQSSDKTKPRTELIAPLDCLLWDRKLINDLFNFHYAWEIYTPDIKRKYGAYTLPILHNDAFIGRVEAICERKSKTLLIKNIWFEEGVKRTKKLQSSIDACLKRFAKFNNCGQIKVSDV